MGGRLSQRPFEGATKGLFGVVADTGSDLCDPGLSGTQQTGGQIQSPLGQVADRWPSEQQVEGSRKAASHPVNSRSPLSGRKIRSTSVKSSSGSRWLSPDAE